MERAGIDPTHLCWVICIWQLDYVGYEAPASWFKLSIRSSSLCLILKTVQSQNDFYQRQILFPDSVIDSRTQWLILKGHTLSLPPDYVSYHILC